MAIVAGVFRFSFIDAAIVPSLEARSSAIPPPPHAREVDA
jgi:hypothetical protein